MTIVNPQTHELEDTIDVKALVKTLIKHWYWIVVCIGISIAAAFLYLRISKPIYAVDGLIQVENTKNASAALLGDLSNVMDIKSPAQTEIELLKSRLVLGQAIANLQLDIGISSDHDHLSQRVRQPIRTTLQHSKDNVFYQSKDVFLRMAYLAVSEELLDQTFTIRLLGQHKYQVSLAEQPLFVGIVGQPMQYQLPQGEIHLLVKSASNQGTLYVVKRSLRSTAQTWQHGCPLPKKVS
jgi:tyrosine-protein kinase Etk/Wzc